MHDYKWAPIQPLNDEDRKVQLVTMQPLYEAWREAKARLAVSSEGSLKRFTERVVRRLSVETGILERIYDLDRGTTEALVAKGFLDDLVSRSDTDIEPSRLIDILRDQEAAIQLVMDCVAHRRELTKGILHELHELLTRHQGTTAAIDQFGQRREIPLRKGRFKKYPNNPRRPDGSVHEYCPPVQVESEVERLLSWFSEYSEEDPILRAAWLHHRFTQIHPYQDGNGRVARALVTFVLLRAELLPLVIDRDLRVDYLDALQEADQGNLSSLVSMFSRLESAAVLEALSIDIDSEVTRDRMLTSAVIASLSAKLGRRRQVQETELRRANEVAQSLRGQAHELVLQTLENLKEPLSNLFEPKVYLKDGGPDHGNAHWYKYDVIESAKAAKKFVNFAEDHYFVKGTIQTDPERLVFVVSFHHVGRELSGIMEATAFARLESFEDSDEDSDEDSGKRTVVSQDFFVCSREPFVFTHQTSASGVKEPFGRWLDVALAVAIKEYGDRL